MNLKTLFFGIEVALLLAALCALVSGAPAARTLNNFVTELLNINIKPTQWQREYAFFNPRTGWIFVASTADVKSSDRLRITLDAEDTPLILHEKGKTKTLEAMRLLPAGKHTLRVHVEGKATPKTLVVRAIPEIGWVTLQNWELMQKHGIQHSVNLLVDYGRARQPEHEQYVQPWADAGKQWLVMCKVPGFTTEKSVTLQDSQKYWAEVLTQNPQRTGFLADEIAATQPGHEESFPVWAEAVRNLKRTYPDRSAYIYCCGPILIEAEAVSLRPVFDALKETAGKLVLEAYLTEKPTREAALAHLRSRLQDETMVLEKVYPDFARHTVLAVGAFDRFGPELNACPHTDFRVFLDMQLQLIATDPGWRNLYGIQPYLTYHMTEETQRWFGKLLRHYCIEGKTDLLSKEYGWKYMLDHIDSPDFAEGTYGYWNLSDETSMKHKVMLGLPYMQGRYDVDTHENLLQGSSFLWTKRKADSPNVFSQEVRNLQPGKGYSVKMWVGDHNDLKTKQTIASSIIVENAELIPEKDVTWFYGIGVINGEYFTHYYRVFRARGSTARLLISDWADAKNPGGPIGQELIYNFIEVQPYLEGEP